MNFIENLLSQRSTKITKDIWVLGIDLGTTNSTVAEVTLKLNEPPKCRTIEIDQPTREGLFTSTLISSVVAILPDKKVWIGEEPNASAPFLKSQISSTRVDSQPDRGYVCDIGKIAFEGFSENLVQKEEIKKTLRAISLDSFIYDYH